MPTKNRPLPPVEYLRECFTYNPKTGVLTWQARPVHHFTSINKCTGTNTRFAGKVVGRPDSTGYLSVTIDGCLYLVHRIIWAVHTGEDPGKYLIDHKDTIHGNNKIKNLRLADAAENCHNGLMRSNNTSGVKGVCWFATQQKWSAGIRTRGKFTFLGYFDDLDEAAAVVIKARKKLHKEFCRQQ